MTARRFIGLLVVAAFVLGSATVGAQSSPKQIGAYNAWEAYVYDERGKKICYMVSTPTDTKPKNVRRGDIYFMVTHRPGENVKDEVSPYIGYPYKDGAAADIKVGTKSFDLITEDENAWAPDPETDGRLVKSMIRGKKMLVHGTSRRGTKTIDTYSLLGFTAAHRAITKACK